MNYLRPDRLDVLARGFALGTLSRCATRRFARVVAESVIAAQAVAAWHEALHNLEVGISGAPAPRPRVWRNIRQQVFERSEQAARPGFGNIGSGRRGVVTVIAGWLGGVVAGALILSAVVALRPQSFDIEQATGAAPASYVGVLLDLRGHAILATTARRHGRVLTVRALKPLVATPDHQWTIWAWNDADATPRRIGNWTLATQTIAVALPMPAEQSLGTMTHLGVSSEPIGSNPASPSRPFVADGPCAKVW